MLRIAVKIPLLYCIYTVYIGLMIGFFFHCLYTLLAAGERTEATCSLIGSASFLYASFHNSSAPTVTIHTHTGSSNVGQQLK